MLPVAWPGRADVGSTRHQQSEEVVVRGFRAFLLTTNALALAVGVILGAAMGSVVSSLVNDIIMPPVGLALGNVDFSQLKVVLKDAADPTKVVAVRYGTFINAVITFVIVALVVYLITKALLRPAPEAPAPATKTCQFCKETVPADATKCRACTSAI
jgi:large conductance mechanosensitive channel